MIWWCLYSIQSTRDIFQNRFFKSLTHFSLFYYLVCLLNLFWHSSLLAKIKFKFRGQQLSKKWFSCRSRSSRCVGVNCRIYIYAICSYVYTRTWSSVCHYPSIMIIISIKIMKVDQRSEINFGYICKPNHKNFKFFSLWNKYNFWLQYS